MLRAEIASLVEHLVEGFVSKIEERIIAPIVRSNSEVIEAMNNQTRAMQVMTDRIEDLTTSVRMMQKE